jgi:uncharacterized protein YdeI (YjbR/CyaY-like superfamily)
MSMGSTDPRVDAYIAKSAPFARPILTHIRTAVHAGCPDVEETMKWNFPHFLYKGILCSMAAFQGHCTFGFWKGSLLQDDGNGMKSGGPMNQFGRVTSVDDLPASKELVALVRKASALNEQGVKVARPKKAPATRALTVPIAFLKALRTHPKALANFKAGSTSHQREYVEWINEAKTDETRDRRIATAVEWLSEGKSRNWKYERKR